MTNDRQDSPSTDMTYEKVISLARELAKSVGRRAADAEVQRCLHEETIQEIVDTGLVRLLIPASFGGHELGMNAYADSTLEIARADASAGWCYSLFILHSWMLARFPEQAQHDVWKENPDALITTSLVPAGSVTETAGGYILNGTWAWSSGVDHSNWCMLGGLVPVAGAQPEFALFLLPRSAYEVLDTWFVAGLRASGSKNVLVREIFVPAHRVARRDARERGTSGNAGALRLLSGFVAPILGATIGAYEIWRDASSKKFTTFTGEQVASLSHVQIRLAEIEAEIQTACLLLQKILDVATPDHPISVEQSFRSSRDAAYIAKLCVEAIERIFLASGGSANYESNPLQRYWRDIHAMAAHAALNFDNAAKNFGRVELGIPPGVQWGLF